MNEQLICAKAENQDLDNVYLYFVDSIRKYFPYYSEKSKDYIINTKYTKETAFSAFKDGFCQICSDNNQIVGLLLVMSKPSAGLWDLGWIIVDENYRGKGIGTNLIQSWEEDAKSKGVHCLTAQTSNEKEIAFYENRGFICFGSIPQGTYGNKKYKFYKIIQEAREENFLRF